MRERKRRTRLGDDIFRCPFSEETVRSREEVILRHAVVLLEHMRASPADTIPYGLVYGILDWPWCLRHAANNQTRRGFRFYSEAALRMIAGDVRLADQPGDALPRDHIVPKSIVRAHLLGMPNLTVERIREVLVQYGNVCVITREEDKRLSEEKLSRAMPSTQWRIGDSPFDRYRAAGIKWTENEHQFGS